MSRVRSLTQRLPSEHWLLAAITLLAAFYRFYRLDQLPPGFHFDPAFYVFDALRLLQGQFSIFFAAPGGSEPLYPYLATVGVAWFGSNTPLGVKITSALLGVATIPVIYLFACTLFRSKRVGLLAALFTAISSWHIFYSRDGERLTLLVLLATLTFLYLWRALEKHRCRDYILTGLFLGLVLYTYPAARIMPPAVVLAMVFAAWQDRTQWRAYAQGLVIVSALAAVLFLPLGSYYVLHPADFISHTTQVSIFASQTNPLPAVVNNAGLLLGMFVLKGDEGIIRNVPGRPVFDPFSGALFLIGVIILAGTLVWPRVSALNRRRAVLLTVWIVLALGLSLFSDDAPNYGRTLIALPAVMILPAWGIAVCWEQWRTPIARRVGAAALTVIFLASGLSTFHDYFITFANLPDLYYAFNADQVEIANWINANANSHHIFLAPLFYQQGTVSLLTHSAHLKSFDSRDTIILPAAGQGQDAIFAFPPE